MLSAKCPQRFNLSCLHFTFANFFLCNHDYYFINLLSIRVLWLCVILQRDKYYEMLIDWLKSKENVHRHGQATKVQYNQTAVCTVTHVPFVFTFFTSFCFAIFCSSSYFSPYAMYGHRVWNMNMNGWIRRFNFITFIICV